MKKHPTLLLTGLLALLAACGQQTASTSQTGTGTTTQTPAQGPSKAQAVSNSTLSVTSVDPNCTTSSATVTCTYTYTGAAQTWTVPAAVTDVQVVARGAAGGNANYAVLGGKGAEVRADLTVSGGQTLTLMVGGAGSQPRGGFNGGSSGGIGSHPGGGGGASDVRVGGSELAHRVLVAAGGGGGGGGAGWDCIGGVGGNVGSAGGKGPDCDGQRGGAGGAGSSGLLGSGGTGGNGAECGGFWAGAGGGGGGGYYGGGGGGGGKNGCDIQISAGGGGGGSNLVPDGGTASITDQSAGITISYTVPDPDFTSPTITLTSPTQDATYTQNQVVNAAYTCADEGWGIASCEGTVPNDTPIDTSSAGTKKFAVTATDDASNQTVKYVTYTVASPDTTAPVITPTVSGTKGTNDWYTGNVNVKWTVTDPESSVTSRTGCDEQNVTSDIAGVTFTCTATSTGGESTQSVTVKRDAAAPTLNPVVSPNRVLLGGTATATPNASDTPSGLASSSCAVPSTGAVGTQSVSCTATDNAGNTATRAATYTVAYPFSGFLQPVDNLPTINTVKAGSSVPVKFSLGGNRGMNILAAGSPTVKVVPCDGSAPADEIEQILTVSNSSLSYDAATDTYSYIWKTDRSWAGSCRQLNVVLTDGLPHLATFKFR